MRNWLLVPIILVVGFGRLADAQVPAPLHPNTNYNNQNFENSNYSGDDASYSSFILADLSWNGGPFRTNFTSVDFTGANLSFANLGGGTDFSSANFNSANLAGANMTNALLRGADLRNSNPAQAISAAQLSSAGVLISANLSGNNLSGFVISGLNFTSVNLSGANLNSANLSGSTLTGADLENPNPTQAISAAQLVSASALQSVNLSGNNLSGYNLTGIDLSSSNLHLANFAGATLTNVILTLTDLRNPDPTTAITAAQLSSAASVAYANLAGNNMSGFSLAGVNLESVNFTGTNLSNANLSNADVLNAIFNGANLSGADLSSTGGPHAVTIAQLKSASLVTGVKFTGSNLSGLNFGTLDLTGASFAGANLSGTAFSGTNLSNAQVSTWNLKTADFSGANLRGTSLGDGTRLDGFIYTGNLTIPTGTTTLQSLGFASLGALTTLNGGTLAAANGVTLGIGCNLTGSGTVTGKIAAGFGSTILATGSLSLGNSGTPVGFVSDGELYTNANTVTLLDSNQAALGSLTQLGSGGLSGTLKADNGVLVDFGKNLVGQGTVDGINALADASIINGSAQGTGTGLIFTGYVKGVGTFSGPITFAGTYSPGQSPAAVSVQDLTLVSTSKLIMEIGGLSAGSQYDQINASGLVTFGGLLEIDLLNGFSGTVGNSFQLFNWTTPPTGSFDQMNLPTLGSGLTWDISNLYREGSISVVAAVPEPSTLALVAFAMGAILVFRKKPGLIRLT